MKKQSLLIMTLTLASLLASSGAHAAKTPVDGKSESKTKSKERGLISKVNVNILATLGAEHEINSQAKISRLGSKYYGGIINFADLLEFQLFFTNDSGTNRSHSSANFHFEVFHWIQPFFNLGPGYLAGLEDPFHINLDVGVQFRAEPVLIRLFHKSQNRLWGRSHYNEGAFLMAAGFHFGS